MGCNDYLLEIKEYLENKGLFVEYLSEKKLEIEAFGYPICVCLAREGFHRSLRAEGGSFPERAVDGREYKIRYLRGYDLDKKRHENNESFRIIVGNQGIEIKVELRKI